MVRVVLVGIEGAYNLGVVIRTCKNFQVDEIFLVNPSADLREASHYAAKARDYLDRLRVVSDLGEAVAGVDLVVATSAKGFSFGDVIRQAVSIEEFTDLIRGGDLRLALLFGRESTGLTRDEIRRADILVSIPANPSYPVLNVAQAVAIFLWEIWKIRGVEAVNIPPRASREEIEELLRIIEDVSSKIFTTRDKVSRTMHVWKQAVFRSRLSRYEAKILTYWFRRMLNRLKT